MVAEQAFQGFPQEAMDFYKALGKHNDRDWFEAHKQTFKDKVQTPAVDFVTEMGERLRTLRPHIIADPRLNGAGSIFRIHRDIRFSKDKTPYQTHLGIFFWEGPGKKTDNPGYYFHLESGRLMLAAGLYIMNGPVLKAYRDSVVDAKRGPALSRAIKKVMDAGDYQLGGRHYKKTPRGYEQVKARQDLLLHNGLYVSIETEVPDEVFTPDLIDYCLFRWKDMTPIQAWTADLLTRV